MQPKNQFFKSIFNKFAINGQQTDFQDVFVPNEIELQDDNNLELYGVNSSSLTIDWSQLTNTSELSNQVLNTNGSGLFQLSMIGNIYISDLNFSKITSVPIYFLYNGTSKQFILDGDVQVNTFNISKLGTQSLNTVVLNLSPGGIYQLTQIGDSYITDLAFSKLSSVPSYFIYNGMSKQYILDGDVQVNTFNISKLGTQSLNTVVLNLSAGGSYQLTQIGNSYITDLAFSKLSSIPNYFIYNGASKQYIVNSDFQSNTLALTALQNASVNYSFIVSGSTNVWQQDQINSLTKFNNYFNSTAMIDYSKLYQSVSNTANSYFMTNNSSNNLQLVTNAVALQSLIPNSSANFIWQMNSASTAQIFALLQNSSIADNTIQLSRILNGTAGYHLYFNSSTGILTAINPTQTNLAVYFNANTIDYTKLYQNVQTLNKYVLCCNASNGYSNVDVTTLVTGTLPAVSGAYNCLQVNSGNSAWTQGLLTNNNVSSGLQFLDSNNCVVLNTGNYIFQSSITSSGYQMEIANNDSTGNLFLQAKGNIQIGNGVNANQGVALYSGSAGKVQIFLGNNAASPGALQILANYSGRSNDNMFEIDAANNIFRWNGGTLGYSWLLQRNNNYQTTSPLGSATPFFQKQLEGNVTNTMVYTDWMTNCSNGNGNPFFYLTTTSASTQIPYCVFYNSGSAASANQIYGYTVSRQVFGIQNEASCSVSTHSNVTLFISNAGLDSWNSGPATYLPLNNTTWVVVSSENEKQGVQAVTTNGTTFFNAVNSLGNLMQFYYKQPSNLSAASFPTQLTDENDFQKILLYSTLNFKQTAQQLQNINFMGAICSNQMPILNNNLGLSQSQWSQVQAYVQNKFTSQTNAQGNPMKTFVNFDLVNALFHQSQIEAQQLIVQMQGQISTLQSQVSTLQSQQTQDQSQISAMGIQLNTANASIATQAAQITSLQSGLTAVQTQVNTLQNLLHGDILLAGVVPHT